MTRLAYTADWLDPAHEYTYTFTLHYYVDDGDVELVRRRETSRRAFECALTVARCVDANDD
jgi:hypothetical protein